MLGAVGVAGARGQTLPAARLDQAAARQITAQLAAREEGSRRAALGQIERFLQSDPGQAAVYLRSGWLKSLVDAREYAAVERLAARGIVALPQDVGSVEALQQARIKALLADGKTEAALAAARGWFNVASLNGTASALLQVAECLNAAHPEDLQLVRRFQAEQVAGAATLPEQASTSQLAKPPASQPASVLRSIAAVDAKAFQAAAEAITAEDFYSLTGKGNLLLLANNPEEAMPIFERAYAVAAEGQLAIATESIARCIKAQDGTIGRANAWVMSLRPAARKREDK